VPRHARGQIGGDANVERATDMIGHDIGPPAAHDRKPGKEKMRFQLSLE
jgi:hypothetical protein